MRRRSLDALTQREREVLALVRLGLTNEEIARRLGISLDGAKYHVSQILSKLGVATREEAAAVAVGERRRWWAAWPLWAKIGGAATVTAAVAGLAVLAWGVLRTDDGTSEAVLPPGPVRVPLTSHPVEGAGMEPTFSDGTLVDVYAYEGAEPQRGDIIVFRSPLTPRDFIKRIIGLPGDRIEIDESTGQVIVSGTALVETYARGPTECLPNKCLIAVPAVNTAESTATCGSPACYFVLGDNRPNSSDSRMGWLVPAENIIGWVAPPANPTP